MQGVRFLTDYLNGDTYYKITHPSHNLERAANQIRLLQCVEEATPRMEAFFASSSVDSHRDFLFFPPQHLHCPASAGAVLCFRRRTTRAAFLIPN